MILRMLALVLAVGSGLTSPLFAGAERGSDLTGLSGGVPGVSGLAGTPGLPGASGFLGFSDFYTLDNPGPIAAGTAVPFTNSFPGNSPAIFSTGPTTFQLSAVGTYLVQFQVDATNAGQLQLRLNGAYVADSVVGRATGDTQIVGISLLTTTAVDSILEVVNPPANTVLNFPAPGTSGNNAISDHLSIIRIQ
jgi:hypothetical protein